MFEIRIQFKDSEKLVRQTVEDYNAGPTMVTLYENDNEVTLVPLSAFLYMDVKTLEKN